MNLFHASGLLYEVGDVIHPGNWGRVILGAGAAHQFYFREFLFEEVRLQLAPDAPSRLRSLFGLRTIEALQAYQQTTGLRHGYRIELSDEANIHMADLAIFDRLFVPNGYEFAKQALTDYWQGTDGPVMEIFAETTGRVLERLGV